MSGFWWWCGGGGGGRRIAPLPSPPPSYATGSVSHKTSLSNNVCPAVIRPWKTCSYVFIAAIVVIVFFPHDDRVSPFRSLWPNTDPVRFEIVNTLRRIHPVPDTTHADAEFLHTSKKRARIIVKYPLLLLRVNRQRQKIKILVHSVYVVDVHRQTTHLYSNISVTNLRGDKRVINTSPGVVREWNRFVFSLNLALQARDPRTTTSSLSRLLKLNISLQTWFFVWRMTRIYRKYDDDLSILFNLVGY